MEFFIYKKVLKIFWHCLFKLKKCYTHNRKKIYKKLRSFNFFKGVFHEIFDLQFFYMILTHLVPWKKQATVFLNSVSISPRFTKTPRCASHHWVKLCGVHHTEESRDEKFSKNSAVCISLRSQALRCASHCGVKLRGVHHNFSSFCFNLKFYQCFSMWCLKILIRNW